MKISADLLGDSDMYMVGYMAGSSSRTEIVTGQKITFQKNMKFKYTN